MTRELALYKTKHSINIYHKEKVTGKENGSCVQTGEAIFYDFCAYVAFLDALGWEIKSTDGLEQKAIFFLTIESA